jgi:hypothetical protein
MTRLVSLRYNIRYTGENTNQEHHAPPKMTPLCWYGAEKRIRVIKKRSLILFQEAFLFL